jgi:hypothetical protein
MSFEPYELHLPPGRWVSLPQKHFRNATDGAPAQQETLVHLQQDRHRLTVAFECRHDPYWQQTSLIQHNADLWQQEVFEVFIAAGEQDATRYLEIELNPNNALFVGWIENPTQEGDANALTMVPYEQAGIEHRITAQNPDSWAGEIHIPFSILTPSGTPAGPHFYRINFYRIILTEPQTTPDWECSPENASFQCWSPTLSGTTPRFHRPAHFGLLEIR